MIFINSCSCRKISFYIKSKASTKYFLNRDVKLSLAISHNTKSIIFKSIFEPTTPAVLICNNYKIISIQNYLAKGRPYHVHTES